MTLHLTRSVAAVLVTALLLVLTRPPQVFDEENQMRYFGLSEEESLVALPVVILAVGLVTFFGSVFLSTIK